MAAGLDGRLDGWKAIGAHFGRDRTTVMRWAQDRQMPVHAVPGGKTRTVFAFQDELDKWARRAGLGSEQGDVLYNELPQLKATNRLPIRWRGGVLGFGLLSAALLAGMAISSQASRQSPVLPSNPAIAAQFVQARDDWATRTAPGLARAIREFAVVAQRNPGFAPTYAYLADAYLLETENGDVDDDVAYLHAKDLAEHALALDPDLAAAHRALGFIAYWDRHDRAEALRQFERALAIDPDDGQTHFWWANILADNGEDARAIEEFDRARILSPGAPEIAADYAWAQWSAGSDGQAEALLASIIQTHPESAEAFDCLSMMRLAKGDVAGYLVAAGTRATLRHSARLIEEEDGLKNALASGGPGAVERQLIAGEDRKENGERFPDHSTAAWIASIAGDRATLMRILNEAESRSETWGSSGYVRRIAQRWRADREVLALLQRRQSGPII